jgi:hypothetical protein
MLLKMSMVLKISMALKLAGPENRQLLQTEHGARRKRGGQRAERRSLTAFFASGGPGTRAVNMSAPVCLR